MQNKPVALVTGANQGIGRQIAKDLVAHGFTVLAGSHNGDQLSALRLDQSQNAMAITSAMSDRRLPLRRPEDDVGLARRAPGTET